MDKVFATIVEDYQRGNLDTTLDEVFSIAAGSGVVLLPGEDHPYTEAKGGPYEVHNLLLPVDLGVWKTLSRAYKAGIKIFPEWFTWNGSYFEFTQSALCKAFISYYQLTKENGTFLAGGKPISDDDIREALRCSLAIVRKDAGSQVAGTFEALKAMCKDSTPPSKRERLTIQALVNEMTARGYDVQYNVITNEYEITGRTEAGRVPTQDDLITIMHDALMDTYKYVSFDTLAQYVTYHAREQRYNPVLEALRGATWDGTNRLPQLYALIGIEEDHLSQVLVRKWLMQSVALLFNDAANPFGADGCLVLNGDQGAGKTSLFRHLAMRDAWFGEGMSIDDHDKDTKRRVLSVWLAELGEVESTLKSDISALKAFVTESIDHYRLPYGKSDVVAPRMTSLCATCNSNQYLIDPTGNRRWWSVPFNRTVPRDELLELDALQLWAQIYALVAPLDYAGKSICYRLTDAERAALAVRNGEYEKPLKGEPEVQDILAIADDNPKKFVYKDITITDFIAVWPSLRKYSAQQIGAALSHCGIEPIRAAKGKRTRRVPVPIT